MRVTYRNTSACLLALLIIVVSGCTSEAPQGDYLARVGNSYLYPDDLELAMSVLPAMGDSSAAIDQIVDQWVTRTLLEQEARQLGLADDDHVKKLLRDSEKSVLVSSLMNRIYSEQGETVPVSDVITYYEQNKSRLKTVEPYVRVRYLWSADEAEAQQARRLLQRAMRGAMTDSLWQQIVDEHASDAPASRLLAGQHYPESRLFNNFPELQELLPRLNESQISSVQESGGRFHLLQVIDRVPTGSEPEFDWVSAELTRQLSLQRRKEALARKVQELRTNALSRNDLEIK